MSRGMEYQFIPTDPEDIVIWLISSYEEITGVTVQPASPERNFIQWMANAIVLERVMTNYTGNQNIPSRAVGSNLDALAELFYEKERPQAKAATCTVRFTISEPQAFAVLIPKGTRVTDARKTLVWETLADVYEMKAKVLAACSADEVRPLTDFVSVDDPESVDYRIRFTYYTQEDSTVSAEALEAAVLEKVEKYITWQSAKLGRDINPSRLISMLMETGIKRVDLIEPAFTALKDGSDTAAPQLAQLDGTPEIINGGYEDE